MLKKIVYLFILVFLIFGLTGCNNSEDYYTIEQVEVDIDDVYEFYNEKLNFVEGDKSNFYVNKLFTIKDFFSYDEADDETKSLLMEDIAQSAAIYGTDLSEYSFKNLETEEIFKYKDLAKGRPMVIIRLSYLCDACEGFKFEWLSRLMEYEGVDYLLVMDNTDVEGQLKYLQEKGADLSKAFISCGALDDTDILEKLGTPSLTFVAYNNLAMFVYETFLLDGDATGIYLSVLTEDEF